MPFERWSPLHFGILFSTAAIAASLIYAGRRKAADAKRNTIGWSLAILQILNTILYAAYRIGSGYWDIRYDLPMEFCNWSLLFSIFALTTQRQLLAEISYLWVMAGSVQGVITPDLQVSYPHVYFFVFFINHSGLTISALYLIFGLKLYPRKGSVLRSIVVLELYVVSALIVNYLVHSNYGYLMSKPVSGSLMDYMGPWPYYIISLQLIAAAAFTILYLPFYIKNKLSELRPEDSEVPEKAQAAVSGHTV